jgi:dihydroneopterin aldolase
MEPALDCGPVLLLIHTINVMATVGCQSEMREINEPFIFDVDLSTMLVTELPIEMDVSVT